MEAGTMTAKRRPPVWVVIGPLNPAKLPKRCVVERVPDELLEMLSALIRSAKDDAARRRRI